MIQQLAGLLLPIDALLAHNAHKDFTPQKEALLPLVLLFRNMRFLCILFHFTVDEKEATAMALQCPALARIAAKTPAMVFEVSHESFMSNIEYNVVIKQDYADTVIQEHTHKTWPGSRY
ncbi:hypothetical protein PM082_013565 [Marasmius tenuissimus]|nr:hypothetical protein PM082_013565 [Marasmius tenuissimus]